MYKPPLYKLINNIITAGTEGDYDTEQIRKIITINFFSIIGVFFMTYLGLKDVLAGEVTLGLGVLSVDLIMLTNAIYLRKSKNHILAGFVIVSIMFLLELFLLITGGTEKSGPLWYFCYPIVALFSLGNKRGNYFIFGLIVTTAALFIWNPSFICDYQHSFKVRFFASFITVVFLSIAAEYVREKNYVRLIKMMDRNKLFLNQTMEHKTKLEVQAIELEKLSIVTEKTDNCVIIIDKKGCIEWVNKAFEEMSGVKLDLIKSMPFVKFTLDVNFSKKYNTCIKEKSSVSYICKRISLKHDEFWLQSTLTPIIDNNGEITRFVCVESDITNIKKAEEEIQKQNNELKFHRDQLAQTIQQLKQLELYKEEMNSLVAQDLRDAINSVILNSSQGVSEKRMQSINQIGKQTLIVVQNILDIKNYENKKIALAIDIHNLAPVVEHAIRDVSYLIEEKNINVTINNDSVIQAAFDYNAMHRVIINALVNSLNHIHAGGNITITVNPKIKSNKTCIAIEDDGANFSDIQLNQELNHDLAIKSKENNEQRKISYGLTYNKLVLQGHHGDFEIVIENNITKFIISLPSIKQIEESNDENKQTADKLEKDIYINSEIKMLEPFIALLKNSDIYETGKNIDIINEIRKLTLSENLLQWTKKMENAIFNFNDEEYKDLLNSINKEE